MFCEICWHLYDLKNVKNTHGGVLLLVKVPVILLHECSSRVFLNCANGTKSCKTSHIINFEGCRPLLIRKTLLVLATIIFHKFCFTYSETRNEYVAPMTICVKYNILSRAIDQISFCKKNLSKDRTLTGLTCTTHRKTNAYECQPIPMMVLFK